MISEGDKHQSEELITTKIALLSVTSNSQQLVSTHDLVAKFEQCFVASDSEDVHSIITASSYFKIDSRTGQISITSKGRRVAFAILRDVVGLSVSSQQLTLVLDSFGWKTDRPTLAVCRKFVLSCPEDWHALDLLDSVQPVEQAKTAKLLSYIIGVRECMHPSKEGIPVIVIAMELLKVSQCKIPLHRCVSLVNTVIQKLPHVFDFKVISIEGIARIVVRLSLEAKQHVVSTIAVCLQLDQFTERDVTPLRKMLSAECGWKCDYPSVAINSGVIEVCKSLGWSLPLPWSVRIDEFDPLFDACKRIVAKRLKGMPKELLRVSYLILTGSVADSNTIVTEYQRYFNAVPPSNVLDQYPEWFTKSMYGFYTLSDKAVSVMEYLSRSLGVNDLVSALFSNGSVQSLVDRWHLGQSKLTDYRRRSRSPSSRTIRHYDEAYFTPCPNDLPCIGHDVTVDDWFEVLDMEIVTSFKPVEELSRVDESSVTVAERDADRNDNSVDSSGEISDDGFTVVQRKAPVTVDNDLFSCLSNKKAAAARLFAFLIAFRGGGSVKQIGKVVTLYRSATDQLYCNLGVKDAVEVFVKSCTTVFVCDSNSATLSDGIRDFMWKSVSDVIDDRDSLNAKLLGFGWTQNYPTKLEIESFRCVCGHEESHTVIHVSADALGSNSRISMLSHDPDRQIFSTLSKRKCATSTLFGFLIAFRRDGLLHNLFSLGNLYKEATGQTYYALRYRETLDELVQQSDDAFKITGKELMLTDQCRIYLYNIVSHCISDVDALGELLEFSYGWHYSLPTSREMERFKTACSKLIQHKDASTERNTLWDYVTRARADVKHEHESHSDSCASTPPNDVMEMNVPTLTISPTPSCDGHDDVVAPAPVLAPPATSENNVNSVPSSGASVQHQASNLSFKAPAFVPLVNEFARSHFGYFGCPYIPMPQNMLPPPMPGFNFAVMPSLLMSPPPRQPTPDKSIWTPPVTSPQSITSPFGDIWDQTKELVDSVVGSIDDDCANVAELCANDYKSFASLFPADIKKTLIDACNDGLTDVVIDKSQCIHFYYGDGSHKVMQYVGLSVLGSCIAILSSVYPKILNKMVRGDCRVVIGPHRVSAIVNSCTITSMTYRVGRILVNLPRELNGVKNKLTTTQPASGALLVLLIGRGGVGKTTLARQLSRACDGNTCTRVMVIDTFGEIGPGAGRCASVPDRSRQYEVMLNCARSHNPKIIVVDEVETADDIAAIKTLMRRGISVIAGVSAANRTVVSQDTVLSQLITPNTVIVDIQGINSLSLESEMLLGHELSLFN